MKLVTVVFSFLHSLFQLLMAPLTLALSAGLIAATWLIVRRLRRASVDARSTLTSGESFEWWGAPTAEWLGA